MSADGPREPRATPAPATGPGSGSGPSAVTDEDRLLAILTRVREDVDHVRRVILSTSDGIPVLETGPMDEPQAAAMSAAVLALGQQIGSLLGGGTLRDCVFRTSNGVVAVLAVGPRYVLAVAASSQVNLALLLRAGQLGVDSLRVLLEDRGQDRDQDEG